MPTKIERTEIYEVVDGVSTLVDVIETEVEVAEEISDKERIEMLEAKIELLLKNLN